MNYKSALFFILITCSATSYLCAQTDQITEGKTIFESKCNQCHPLSRPLDKKKNLEEWNITTLRMSKKIDSNINEDEAKKIAEYLTAISTQ